MSELNNETWEKMLRGEVYDALDPLLISRLERTRAALHEYNNLHPDRLDERNAILPRN
ncbi:MAG: hypothetical protein K2M97_06460 [Muribaculaceae bacterium]|nr:hypothetical protein [Muribaculaceae bacterium]